jgi:hypothetical protein
MLRSHARNFWQPAKRRFHISRQRFRRCAKPSKQWTHYSIRLRNQCSEKVQRLDLLLIVPRGNFLRFLKSFLGFNRQFVEA